MWRNMLHCGSKFNAVQRAPPIPATLIDCQLMEAPYYETLSLWHSLFRECGKRKLASILLAVVAKEAALDHLRYRGRYR